MKPPPTSPATLFVFRSQLQWMAVLAAGTTVKQLAFGHPTAAAARSALDGGLLAGAAAGEADSPLVQRLQAYAAGAADDFRDVPLDLPPSSPFQRRVLEQCRRIPYGSMLTYGELAAKAGYPGAARAVGNCMAANRIPLLIPCHRVVCAGGRLGSYSAPGGAATKRRLLALESGELS
jgi:methylated-DNA-[protein]-cysteine S-methyltransferase